MADQRIRVRIEGDSRNLRDELRRTEDRLDKTEGSFTRLRTEWLKVTAAAAAVFASLRGGFRLWAEQERAVSRLNAALSQVPGATRETSAALQEQASILAQVSSASDEAIITSQALFAQFGVSADRIQEATRAAVNLSEAFGISLEQATRQLARTTGGFAGELGEILPELKELSREALLAGEAIEIVGRRFQGTAQRTVSVEKSVNNLTDAFKDLGQAVLGSAFQFANTGGILDNIATVIGGLADEIADFTGLSDRLTESVRETGNAAKEAAPAFGDFGDSIEDAERNFRNFILDFSDANRVIDENREAVVTGGEAYDEFGRLLPTEEVEDLGTEIDDTTASFRANTDAIRANIEEQRRLREEARATTTELQQLAIALGVDPSDPNLALTQGGSRLRFTGGSRLVGRSRFTTGGGTLTTRNGRTVITTPDGRVIDAGGIRFG